MSRRVTLGVLLALAACTPPEEDPATCGACPAPPVVSGGAAVLPPPDTGFNPQTVDGVLQGLRDRFDLRPTASLTGAPVVLVKVILTAGNPPRLDPMGMRNDVFREGGIEARTAGRAAPPDFWLIVTDDEEKPVYWRGFSDPRRAARVEGPGGPGNISGIVAPMRELVVAFRVPFVPDGSIHLAEQPPPGAPAKGPLATYEYADEAPLLFEGGIP